MRGLTTVGVILLVLGILSFIVPVPQREEHSMKIGDAKIGLQTESSQKLPPAVGVVLVVAGAVVLTVGARKS